MLVQQNGDLGKHQQGYNHRSGESSEERGVCQLLVNFARKKGMTIEEARKLVVNPLYLGCLIIKNGDADGQLAGARNTTGDVLRPALQIIKTTPALLVYPVQCCC